MVLNVKFERFKDISYDRILGKIGVYVIWSKKSVNRPSYIGEGVITDRVMKQLGPQKGNGTIAILGDVSLKKYFKKQAEIVEAILLKIANSRNRPPSNNRVGGKRSSIDKILRSDGVIKINFTGYDPLRLPNSPRMANKKTVKIFYNSEGDINYTNPWKRSTK